MQSGQALAPVPDHLARAVMEAVQSVHAYGDTFLTAIKRILDKEEPDYRQ